MDVISILATIVGLAGAAGGAAGFYKSARGKAVIELLTTENDALSKSNARLEKERDVARAERDALAKRNEELVGLAQGSPQLEKLTSAIENQTQVIKAALQERKS